MMIKKINFCTEFKLFKKNPWNVYGLYHDYKCEFSGVSAEKHIPIVKLNNCSYKNFIQRQTYGRKFGRPTIEGASEEFLSQSWLFTADFRFKPIRRRCSHFPLSIEETEEYLFFGYLSSYFPFKSMRVRNHICV